MADFKSALKSELRDIKRDELGNNYDTRYEKLDLKFNPFPAAAIAQYTHLDPVDKTITDKINYFIKTTYRKGEKEGIGDYAGLTIVGDYGFGKTHLMKYIQSFIEELNKEEEIDFNAITSFIDKPEDEPNNIIHKILEDLEPDSLRRLVWATIFPHIIPIERKELGEKFFNRSLFGQSENFDELYEPPKKSNPLVFYDIFKRKGGNIKFLQEEAVRAILENKIVDDISLAERYVNLIFPEKKGNISWEVLTGYISSKDIQKKEVKFLNSIINILRKNGYNMLYVFIDEFEDLGKLKGPKLTNYINTLNTMINRQRKWAVIVSLTQDALETIRHESPPLYDRLNTIQVRLIPLYLETARNLTYNYLNHSKIDGKEPNIFSDDLLEKMIERTEGNYRAFIQLSSKLIEYLADQENIILPAEGEIIEDLPF